MIRPDVIPECPRVQTINRGYFEIFSPISTKRKSFNPLSGATQLSHLSENLIRNSSDKQLSLDMTYNDDAIDEVITAKCVFNFTTRCNGWLYMFWTCKHKALFFLRDRQWIDTLVLSFFGSWFLHISTLILILPPNHVCFASSYGHRPVRRVIDRVCPVYDERK